MAKLIQAFDATQWNPEQSAGQLPIGRHKVIIDDSEVKANNANTGGYLALTLQVIEGPSAGATGIMRLNLYSQSEKAVEIAHRQLSSVCHAIGVFNVQDSAQLHNIPFVVEVGNQKPTQEQEEKRARGEEVTLYTEVKKVFDVNGNAPGKKGASPAPAATPVAPSQPSQPNFNVAPANWATPAEQAPTATPVPNTWAPPSQPVATAPAGGPAPWGAR